MKKSPTLLTGVALFAALGFLCVGPCARAQQADNPFSFANPGASTEKPAPGKPDPNAPAETEILASKGANFDSKKRIAVFEGDVRVNDPRYQLACETLTVYLVKNDAADQGKGGAPDAANKPPAKSDDQGGGIDHATAEGRVIIIQRRAPAKPGEEEKVSVGRSDRGDFDNKTGDMRLSGTPSIEQNGNLHIATSRETVMILNREGGLKTFGPSRTIFKSKAGAGDFPGGSPAASPGKPTGGDKKHRGGNAAPTGQ